MQAAEVVDRPAAPPPLAEPEWITRATDEFGWTWARRAWERASKVEGAWFDYAKADAIVAKWPTWFFLTDDRFAGVPFILSFWQEVIVRLLVGWKRPIEVVDPRTHQPAIVYVRLFRRLDLWIPRKNGKSEFLAALALLFWAIEGVVGGQGFCFARDEKQGKIVFAKMAVMVGLNPQLMAKVSAFAKSFWMAERRSSFELLSGKAEGKHGRSPTVIVGDEMHEWRSTDLATNLRQGTGARLQPIELYGSTAGIKSERTGWELFEQAVAILDGVIDDPTTLIVLFYAGEEEDWQDEAVWRRVNPNVGLSPTMDFLRSEAAKAALNPRAEAHFRRYHLNQWVESISRWLPIEKWKACGASADWKTRAERFLGRRCVGAFDVSSTQDLTALLWWFLPTLDDPVVNLLCRFWVPQATIELRSKRDRVDYEQWSRIGAIEPTPGDYVDQSYLQKAILEGLEMFDVSQIGFDPWNARKLVTDLQAEGVDAERFIEVRQGIPSLGEASKHFEKLVFAGHLDHGGHPVMHWNGRNALIRFDRNMNFKPDKEFSREKIDGIIAAVTAGAVAIAGEEPMNIDDFLNNPVHS